MIIVGAGNLGQALANYVDFEKRGFKLLGIFDVNPVLEGIAVRGIEIQMISNLPFFLRENNIEIAILTLPKNKAKDMADILIENGIKAIWNFAHIDLDTPDDVIVENVHLSESISFHMCLLFLWLFFAGKQKMPDKVIGFTQSSYPAFLFALR